MSALHVAMSSAFHVIRQLQMHRQSHKQAVGTPQRSVPAHEPGAVICAAGSSSHSPPSNHGPALCRTPRTGSRRQTAPSTTGWPPCAAARCAHGTVPTALHFTDRTASAEQQSSKAVFFSKCLHNAAHAARAMANVGYHSLLWYAYAQYRSYSCALAPNATHKKVQLFRLDADASGLQSRRGMRLPPQLWAVVAVICMCSHLALRTLPSRRRAPRARASAAAPRAAAAGTRATTRPPPPHSHSCSAPCGPARRGP